MSHQESIRKYKYRNSEKGIKTEYKYRKYYYTLPEKRIQRSLYEASRRASKKGIVFDPKLKEIFKDSIPIRCRCCGIDFDFSGGRATKDAALSFDRVDSTKGYTIENTRAICWRCNRQKSDATISELRMIINYMEHPND